MVRMPNCIKDCWNRFLRHLNICNNGWPPSHLNADGDWKNEEDDNCKV